MFKYEFLLSTRVVFHYATFHYSNILIKLVISKIRGFRVELKVLLLTYFVLLVSGFGECMNLSCSLAFKEPRKGGRKHIEVSQ